jgi:hypothetical protein
MSTLTYIAETCGYVACAAGVIGLTAIAGAAWFRLVIAAIDRVTNGRIG